MLNFLIAHAGETHESTIETTAHSMAWYLQLPLFIIGMTVFAGLVWILTKKQLDTTILVTSFALLVTGIGFFSIAPIVSALAITVGLTTTLLSTLFGLGASPKK